MRASFWRIDTEADPKLVVCSTDKWVDGLQPFLDEDEQIVLISQTHFTTKEEAIQAVVLSSQQSIEALKIEHAITTDKLVALEASIAEAEERLTEYQKKSRVKKPKKEDHD
jgi:hypothetical protein